MAWAHRGACWDSAYLEPLNVIASIDVLFYWGHGIPRILEAHTLPLFLVTCLSVFQILNKKAAGYEPLGKSEAQVANHMVLHYRA